MKKLFVMGVCALFIACSNSPEKTTGTAADLKTDAQNPAVTGTAPADTSQAASSAPAATAPVATAPATPAAAPAKAAAADGPSAKKGAAMISKLDCLVCHKLDTKVIGPAYADVAKKYPNTEANVNHLADKIIKGGSGVWGQVPMAPHPTLSEDDARSLAMYVLTVK